MKNENLNLDETPADVKPVLVAVKLLNNKQNENIF